MEYKFEKPIEASIGKLKYQCTIEWRNGKIIVDEPITEGGRDSGPDPYSLLLSSLASCTLITLRMYIDRKEWDIPEIAVKVNIYPETDKENNVTIIENDILFNSPVTDEQKVRLMQIAKHCPISKILENEIRIKTFTLRTSETKTIKYSNDKISVLWKPELCKHSTRCWKQLPLVFNPKLKKWINPDGASPEEIENQVRKCPSGALTAIKL